MVKYSLTDQLLKAIRLLEANGYRVVKARSHKSPLRSPRK